MLLPATEMVVQESWFAPCEGLGWDFLKTCRPAQSASELVGRAAPAQNACCTGPFATPVCKYRPVPSVQAGDDWVKDRVLMCPALYAPPYPPRPVERATILLARALCHRLSGDQPRVARRHTIQINGTPVNLHFSGLNSDGYADDVVRITDLEGVGVGVAIKAGSVGPSVAMEDVTILLSSHEYNLPISNGVDS